MKIKIKFDIVSVFLLFILMLVLKIRNVITISWFWVLSPLWIFAAMILLVIIIAVLYTLVRVLIDLIKYRKFKKSLQNARIKKDTNNETK